MHEEPAHAQQITLDAYAASHRAVREMKDRGELPGRVRVRSSQYLNHLVEQDHRRVKQRIRPMPGFKRFDHAAVTISGIELAEKIKKWYRRWAAASLYCCYRNSPPRYWSHRRHAIGAYCECCNHSAVAGSQFRYRVGIEVRYPDIPAVKGYGSRAATCLKGPEYGAISGP
jgi:hypothetical protein